MERDGSAQRGDDERNVDHELEIEPACGRVRIDLRFFIEIGTWPGFAEIVARPLPGVLPRVIVSPLPVVVSRAAAASAARSTRGPSARI